MSVAGWSSFVTVHVAVPPFGMTTCEQLSYVVAYPRCSRLDDGVRAGVDRQLVLAVGLERLRRAAVHLEREVVGGRGAAVVVDDDLLDDERRPAIVVRDRAGLRLAGRDRARAARGVARLVLRIDRLGDAVRTGVDRDCGAGRLGASEARRARIRSRDRDRELPGVLRAAVVVDHVLDDGQARGLVVVREDARLAVADPDRDVARRVAVARIAQCVTGRASGLDDLVRAGVEGLRRAGALGTGERLDGARALLDLHRPRRGDRGSAVVVHDVLDHRQPRRGVVVREHARLRLAGADGDVALRVAVARVREDVPGGTARLAHVVRAGRELGRGAGTLGARERAAADVGAALLHVHRPRRGDRRAAVVVHDVLDHDEVRALRVREGAGDVLAGREADRARARAVAAGRARLVPAGGNRLGDRVRAGGQRPGRVLLSVRELEVRAVAPREGEELRIAVRVRLLLDDDRAALRVRVRARDGLAGVEVDVRRLPGDRCAAVLVRAGEAREVPAGGRRRLGDGVRPGREAREGLAPAAAGGRDRERARDTARPRVAERPVAADRDLVDHDVGRREDRPGHDLVVAVADRSAVGRRDADVVRAARDRAGTDPRAPAAGTDARREMPTEEEHDLRSIGRRRNRVRQRDVRVLVARSCRIVVRVCRGAGELPTVEREDLAAELVPGGGAARPVQIRDDGGVARNRERRGRAGNAVRRVEVRAAISARLRLVPGREGVVRVHPTLAGEEGDLDRATGGRAVLREVEDHALWRDVVLRVVRVVGIQDPVDPVLRTVRRRARRPAVGALVETRDRSLRSGRGARYRRDRQQGCRRNCRDDERLEGTHLPHLRCLPFARELDANPRASPSSFKRNGPRTVIGSHGSPRSGHGKSLERGSGATGGNRLADPFGGLPDSAAEGEWSGVGSLCDTA